MKWTLENTIESEKSVEIPITHNSEDLIAKSSSVFFEAVVEVSNQFFLDDGALEFVLFYAIDRGPIYARAFSRELDPIFKDVRMSHLLKLFILKNHLRYIGWSLPLSGVHDGIEDIVSVQWGVDTEKNGEDDYLCFWHITNYILGKDGKVLDSMSLDINRIDEFLEKVDFELKCGHMASLLPLGSKEVLEESLEAAENQEKITREPEGLLHRMKKEEVNWTAKNFIINSQGMIKAQCMGCDEIKHLLVLMDLYGNVILYSQEELHKGVFPTCERSWVKSLIKKHTSVGVAWNFYLKHDNDHENIIACGSELKGGDNRVFFLEMTRDNNGKILDISSIDNKEKTERLLHESVGACGYLLNLFGRKV